MSARFMRSALALGIALAHAGCDDGKGINGPTGPTASVSVTGLAISPATDLMKLKGSETFSVTATLSDGGSRAAQPAWSSDAPSVATIDSGGRAAAVAPGEATIVADYEGHRATRRLRIVPDYQGSWNGDHRVSGCSADGDWRGFCGLLDLQELFPMALVLTQNRDAVSGTVDLGEPGPVQGSIRISGHLALTGSYSVPVDDVTLQVALSDWETLTLDNERMAGRFTIRFSASALTGSLQFVAELSQMAKGPGTLVGSRESDRSLGRAIARGLRRR